MRASITVTTTLLLVALCGCGGDSGDSGTDDRDARKSSTSPATTATGPEPVVCPNPNGGECLGQLAAGTYRTETFTPTLTYRVSDGWSNMEDLPGNFLLLAPGRAVNDVDAGRADYVAVYSGATVAAADCTPRPEPGVGHRPEAILRALQERPGLKVTAPRPVAVGGLEGLAATITSAAGTDAGCIVEGGLTIVPMIIGTGPAELEHAQVAGLRTHLYVLAEGASNVVVEVSDVGSDHARFAYKSVVAGLRFGQE
jgi:hypothetical protein